jgi:hypothetical protein
LEVVAASYLAQVNNRAADLAGTVQVVDKAKVTVAVAGTVCFLVAEVVTIAPFHTQAAVTAAIPGSLARVVAVETVAT